MIKNGLKLHGKLPGRVRKGIERGREWGKWVFREEEGLRGYDLIG